MHCYAESVDRASTRLIKIICVDQIPHVIINRYGFDSLPDYHALSYTWGPPQPDMADYSDADKRLICLNGLDFAIFPNLYDALLQLYQSYPDMYFWIDAICIDQGNCEERETQVGIMNEIYRRASKVVVWLGKKRPRVDNGIEILRRFQAIATREVRRMVLTQKYDYAFELSSSKGLARYGLDPMTGGDVEAFIGIYESSWFQRTWVIQEVALAREVEVLLGDTTLSWDSIGMSALFLHLSGLLPAMEIVLVQLGRSWGGLSLCLGVGVYTAEKMHLIREWCRGEASPLHDVLKLVDFTAGIRESGTPGTVILKLLLWAVGFRASDRRDSVNAFLGILNHVCAGAIPDRLRADYGISTAEVLQNLAIEVLESTGSLTILTLVRDPSVRDVPGVPSWVPDFSRVIGANPIAGPNFKSLGKFDASKCGDSFGPEFRVDGRKLHVRGFRLGTVNSIGETCLEFVSAKFEGMFSFLIDADRTYAPTGQPRNEAFWRTLLFDQDLSNRPAASTLSRPFRNLFASLLISNATAALRDAGDKVEALRSYLDDRASIFKLAAQEPESIFPSREFIESCCTKLGLVPGVDGEGPLTDAALQAWREEELGGVTLVGILLGTSFGFRRPLITDMGHLACAPQSAEAGDEVWIVARCHAPLILRRVGQSSYSLVGEAYVHGVMYGEAVPDGIIWESICLV